MQDRRQHSLPRIALIVAMALALALQAQFGSALAGLSAGEAAQPVFELCSPSGGMDTPERERHDPHAGTTCCLAGCQVATAPAPALDQGEVLHPPRRIGLAPLHLAPEPVARPPPDRPNAPRAPPAARA